MLAQCWPVLGNAGSVLANVGLVLANVVQCCAMLGQFSAILANAGSVLGHVGPGPFWAMLAMFAPFGLNSPAAAAKSPQGYC